MKAIKKNVFYCDYCKKHGLSASAMKVHESHCTANPNRKCRLCEGGPINDLIESFKARFELKTVKYFCEYTEPHEQEIITAIWKNDPVTLDEIRNAVDGCPNCMLAIIRQCGFNRYYFDDQFKEFNYKDESHQAFVEKMREIYNDEGRI
jgi:hypothetical protein